MSSSANTNTPSYKPLLSVPFSHNIPSHSNTFQTSGTEKNHHHFVQLPNISTSTVSPAIPVPIPSASREQPLVPPALPPPRYIPGVNTASLSKCSSLPPFEYAQYTEISPSASASLQLIEDKSHHPTSARLHSETQLTWRTQHNSTERFDRQVLSKLSSAQTSSLAAQNSLQVSTTTSAPLSTSASSPQSTWSIATSPLAPSSLSATLRSPLSEAFSSPSTSLGCSDEPHSYPQNLAYQSADFYGIKGQGYPTANQSVPFYFANSFDNAQPSLPSYLDPEVNGVSNNLAPAISSIPGPAFAASSLHASSSLFPYTLNAIGQSSFLPSSPASLHPFSAYPRFPPQHHSDAISSHPSQTSQLAWPKLTAHPPKFAELVTDPESSSPTIYLCKCCPKKPGRFLTYAELRSHEAEKAWKCNFCSNRFKKKNEAERHQNSLHLRRHSWSCAALVNIQNAFQPNAHHHNRTSSCGYCGKEFSNVPELNWKERSDHLHHDHKYGDCNAQRKFFRADHFRQHLKHSHAATSGRWTNILEQACVRDELLPATVPPSMIRSSTTLDPKNVFEEPGRDSPNQLLSPSEPSNSEYYRA